MFTKLRMKEEKGFTLIELLIVVAIIGILAAIAIPQFGAYRKRGYNAAANSDLRGLRTSEEAMATDFGDYGSSQLTSLGTRAVAGVETTGATFYLVGGKTQTTNATVQLSPNVRAAVLTDSASSGTANAYWNAATTHISGDAWYGVDSEPSRLVKKARPATSYVDGSTLATTPAATVASDFASPWADAT